MTRTNEIMPDFFHEEMRRRMKMNYDNGGKERKQLKYYYKKHTIDATFFNGENLQHSDKIKKIKEHFSKIKSANKVERDDN
jgi:hypothetical protein